MVILSLPPRQTISQRQLLGALLLLLLIPDVLPDDRLLEADGTHTVSPGPEMQPREVAGPPKIFARMRMAAFPCKRPTAFATLYLGGMLRHQCTWSGMACPSTNHAHLMAEFPQNLADVLAERAKDGFLPLLRYDDNVVSAIPPDMALVVPFSHCGFSFVWPWRVHPGRNHSPLHESTPERQSLFESHRQRRWLTYWSYHAGGRHGRCDGRILQSYAPAPNAPTGVRDALHRARTRRDR